MGMTNPFPEPDSPDLERFAVYARVEILGVLRQLLDNGVLITAYFGSDAGFAVTALLAVNPDFEEVVFDNPSDALALRRLLAAEAVTFVAFMDQVKVQFTARAAEATQFGGKGALRVRLPEQMLRLQRRDFFRVRPPLAKPPQCLVPSSDDGKQYEKLRVLDISTGGLAVVIFPARFDLPLAATIDNCFLDLPGVGSVGVGLKIRHVDPMPRDDKARRVGCEFVNLAPQARVLLQRYVNQLDAEQRKMVTRVA